MGDKMQQHTASHLLPRLQVCVFVKVCVYVRVRVWERLGEGRDKARDTSPDKDVCCKNLSICLSIYRQCPSV